MANNRIDYSIGFKVDQTGLNQAKSALQELQRLSAGDLMEINNTSFDQAKKDLKELKANASVLENALSKAFNANLGTVNVSKFNQELKKSNITLDQIYAGMSKAGYAGEAAFRKTATQVLTTNTQLKQSHKILDDIAKTMGNTIKWGIASSAMNTFTGSIQKAYGYVKHLDSSLNDIRIVTEKSAEQMDAFAVKANKAAKNLAASTTDYTEAALIYYQQGLADKEVQARAESTLKAANVTGQSGAEVSEQLTAVWNGYKVSAQETELYVDKLAAVAASTASDLEELSTGMSKVASAAAASGVDIDQLNGHLATVISVTRQAPESVGTAFKTIYARLGDLAVDGEDEFGTKLGEVSSKLKTMGIDILDSQGQMRDMGTVMEEVAEKWDGWTQAQRQAAAVAMAGKRQYNNLIALFDNWDMYTDAVNTSANAMGTLQNQQDIYMESTAAHLQKMQTSWEGVYDSVLDTDTINFWLDAFAGLGTGLEHLVDGLGGGNNALLLLGSTAMKVFDKQIANSLSITLNNFKKVREQAQNTQAILATQSLFKDQRVPDALFNDLVKMKQSVLELGTIVSSEEHEIAHSLMQGVYAVREQAMAWDDNLQSLTDYARGLQGYDFDAIFRDISAFGADDKDAEMFSLKGITGDEEAVIDLNNAITAQKEIISHATNEVSKYDKELEKLLPALKDMEMNTGSATKSSGKLSAEEQKGIHIINSLKASMEDYSKQVTLSKSNQKAFDAVLGKSWQAYQNNDISIQKMAMMLSGTFKKALADGGKDAQRFADMLEQEINQASGIFNREVTEMEQKWKSFQQQLQQKSNIANVVSLIGTMGQLASAMQTIINLGSVWQNEDLSTGEKLLQTISSLGMTLPMLTMNLGQAKDALMLIGGKLGVVDKAFLESMGKAHGLTEKLGILKGALGPLARSFGPYIAVAALAVGAATALYMWWTKDERAAKKAAEGARQAAEALEAVKTEQQAVADTLSAYEDAEIAMSKLTKGTQEWRDALNETNNSVLTLLETFPELADTTKRYMENVNGQLVLTDEGKEYVQEQSSSKVAAAQSASYAANAESLKAQNISDITDFARSVQVQTGGHGGTSGSVSSDAVDRAIEAINTSGSAYLSSVETIQEELGVSRTVAEALYANTEELTILAGTISANTAAQELYYQQAAAGYLQDSETYQNATTEEQGVIDQVAGSWLEKEADRLYESTYKQGSGMSDKDAQQAYAELIGAEDSKNKGGNKGEYLIDGEWKTVADEVARMALAMQEASGGVDAFAEDVLAAGDTISGLGLDDSTESAVLGFANGETADLTNLTATQLEEMSNALDGMSDEAIDQLADQLGYVSDGVKSAGDIFKEKVSQAAEDEVTRRAEDVAAKFAPGEDGFAKTSQDLHDSLNNMSIEDFRGEQRDALTAAGGTDALLASIDPEQIQRLVTEGVSLEDAFNEIDWSSMDSSKPTEWFKGAFEQAINDAKYSKENEGDVEGNFAAHAEEYDIDETVYRDLTERIQENAEASDDFADSLKTQEDAAQEVAKEILRYDKALESVQENGEEWLEVLENGAEQDLAENIGAISEAYENMLDLDPGALSDDFLENAENMKLMQQAAEGNTEAYEELQKRAGEDILAQVGIDTSQYAEDLAAIESMKVNAEGQGLADLEAGATLDNTAFLNSLSEMVTEAGMSAEEAQNYLASMGIDAEVTEDTTDATENNTINSLMPSLSWENKSWNLPLVGDFTLPLPKLKFNPVPSPFSNKKQFKAHGLKVSNAKKSSGGAIKHKNSSHGGGSKKPSGGGGGGGGSTPKRAVKTSEKKFDRYRKVNNNLSKLSTEMERLTKAQDKLFGKDLLNNLNKQLDVLKKQVTQTKKKLALAKAEAKEMRTKRQKNYKDENGYVVKNDLKDFGIKFNKKGAITNYKTKMQWYDKEIADAEARWNTMTAKEQEKNKSLGNRIEALKNNRDVLEKLVKDYDTLIYDTIPGLQDEITEFAYAQIEIKLKKFNLEAELRVDLTEAIKQWQDFQDELRETNVFSDLEGVSGLLSAEAQALEDSTDNLYSATEDLINSGLTKTLTGDVNDMVSEITKIRNNPKTYSGQFAARGNDGKILKDSAGKVIIDEKALWDALDESMENLEQHIIDIEASQKQALENLLEAVELVNEAYDQQYETIQFMDEQLEHSLEMTKLLKGENAYEDMATYYAEAAANAESMAATAAEEMSYWETMMNDESLTEEQREAARKNYMDAANDYQDALRRQAEIAQAAFENAVQKQLKAMDDALGASKAFSTWELEMEKEDDYLDEVNAAFGRQTFIANVRTEIDNTDSISAQKKLNDLLDDELAKLDKKDKLTQYDIDRANKRLEIEMKRIALEEAQQNKSQMRLRRDSSGNYSYQFVGDEDKQKEAEQELRQAENDLYNMDKEQVKANMDEIQNIYQEMQDYITEYYQMSSEKRAAHAEEYNARIKYYEDRLKELAKDSKDYQLNLSESTFESMKGLYADDESAFKDLTAAEKAMLKDTSKSFKDLTNEEKNLVNNSLKPTWTKALDVMIGKINDEKGFSAVWKTAMDGIAKESTNCANKLKDLDDKSKKTFGDSKTYANQWLTKQKAVTAECKNTVTELESTYKNLTKILNAWKKVKTAGLEALKVAENYKETVLKEEADEVGKKKKTTKKKTTTTTTTTTTDNKSEDGGDNDGGDGVVKVGDEVTFVSGKYHNDSYGGSPHGDRGLGKKTKVNIVKTDNRPYPIHVKSSTGAFGWVKKEQLKGFDTGGYTGEWTGGEGKVAMLHSKELVLNASDTENILATVALVRSIIGELQEMQHLENSKENDSNTMLLEQIMLAEQQTVLSIEDFKQMLLYLNDDKSTFTQLMCENEQAALEKINSLLVILHNTGATIEDQMLVVMHFLEKNKIANSNRFNQLKNANDWLKQIKGSNSNRYDQLAKVLTKLTNVNANLNQLEAKMQKNTGAIVQISDMFKKLFMGDGGGGKPVAANPKGDPLTAIGKDLDIAKKRLYNIRKENMDTIINTLTRISNYAEGLNDNVKNFTAMQWTDAFNWWQWSRQSLYSIRHIDFETLWKYFQEGEIVLENAEAETSGSKLPTADAICARLDSFYEKLSDDLHGEDGIGDKLDIINQTIIDKAAEIIQSSVNVAASSLLTHADFADAAPVIYGAESDKTIEQTVNINADFPDVENISEIIAAFEELINRAIQHTN